jgi:hypothetical protein
MVNLDDQETIEDDDVVFRPEREKANTFDMNNPNP